LTARPRIGVASLTQETNTFAVGASTLEDFERNGLYLGDAAREHTRGSNTEIAGACEELERAGAECVPIARAWAMSGPPLTATAFEQLASMLETEVGAAGALDGLVLALHGALCAEGAEHADAAIAARLRAQLGEAVVIGVCLDLHANVTGDLVAAADFVIGYRTYPHVDQAETGRRTARLVLATLGGRVRPTTALAKRPMLVPPETCDTSTGPLGEMRAAADEVERAGALDASVFPVQPWLDVEDLGFSALVTTDGDRGAAAGAAELLADRAWAMRERFEPRLLGPLEAIERVRRGARPGFVSESADSPTAGAAADSPAMVDALLRHGAGLTSYVTVVDRAAVAACFKAGTGGSVDVAVGASVDARFHAPVPLAGAVIALHTGPVTLAGPVWAGMSVSMGRAAVIRRGTVHVIVTEQPACTFDQAPFRALGLEPADADLIVVRSATLFRAGFAELMRDEPLFLDLPGASSPRFSRLPYERARRPLYPLPSR
jgi:microcystin degradation protein MlrC